MVRRRARLRAFSLWAQTFDPESPPEYCYSDPAVGWQVRGEFTRWHTVQRGGVILWDDDGDIVRIVSPEVFREEYELVGDFEHGRDLAQGRVDDAEAQSDAEAGS